MQILLKTHDGKVLQMVTTALNPVESEVKPINKALEDRKMEIAKKVFMF